MDSIFSFLRFVFRYHNKAVDQVLFYVSLICAITMVVHVGYITDPAIAEITKEVVVFMYYGLFLFETIRTVSSILVTRKINVSHYSGVVITAYFLVVTISRHSGGLISTFAKDEWLYMGIAIM